jgi:murein DD-endopeptidase MepM/ murein hydrolase activator NlpD
MHKGLDFAAPSGTPIYAAGKGVIERANRFSSFGNYVKIRHNDKYQTAYAHLKGFARGIKKGVHVKQGQVIGYVGTTGRSTGPHLHYEVHVNGKAVNPQSVDLPIGETLSGTNLANFKIRKEKLDKMFNEAISKAKLIQVTTTADDIANEAIEAETISH